MWILARTRDGSGTSAPREVIHLLTAARDSQGRLIEIGEVDDAAYLIGRAPLKTASKILEGTAREDLVR